MLKWQTHPMTAVKEDINDLNDEQKSLVKEFRTVVADLLGPEHDDYYLQRWLKARKYNIEKAEKMLREHFKFRKNMELDTILTDFKEPEILTKHKSTCFAGYDKEGSPILILLGGRHDLKGFVYSLTQYEMMKSILYDLEFLSSKAREECKRRGKSKPTITVIFDLDCFNFIQVVDKTVLKLHIDFIQMFEANYPEILKCAYIVNAPSFFYYWFNVFKPFIQPETLAKVKIYAKDYWKEDLLKAIDEEILPGFLGGTRTDPDGNPRCLTLLQEVEKIPPSCYLSINGLELQREPGMTDICVRERAFFNHNVLVRNANSTIQWFFYTQGYNIRFGVYQKCPDMKSPRTGRRAAKKELKKELKNQECEVVIPVDYVESHVVPERGELMCETAGLYVLHFDNTFSWMTPKHLSYKAEVLSPSDCVSNGVNGE